MTSNNIQSTKAELNEVSVSTINTAFIHLVHGG